MKIRRVTQLQLDGFADLLRGAEECGQGEQPMSWKEIQERELGARLALRDMLEAGEELPSWAETYHTMIESGIPWKVAAFVAWSTTIKKYRWPRTLDELATEVLGLNSSRRIFEWRRKYPYIDQMIADLQASAYLEYVPGAIAASGEVASRADYKSTAERRLLYEAVGIIENRSRIQVEEGAMNLGAGRRLLDQMRKKSTSDLLDFLGPEAPELMRELEEEVEQDGGGEQDGQNGQDKGGREQDGQDGGGRVGNSQPPSAEAVFPQMRGERPNLGEGCSDLREEGQNLGEGEEGGNE